MEHSIIICVRMYTWVMSCIHKCTHKQHSVFVAEVSAITTSIVSVS